MFLNKKDIFEGQIKKTPLSVCFPDYPGPEKDVHAALAFLEAQYAQVMEAAVPGKELHAHVVAARVRMDMKVAWGDVKDQVSDGVGRFGGFLAGGSGRGGELRRQRCWDFEGAEKECLGRREAVVWRGERIGREAALAVAVLCSRVELLPDSFSCRAW